MLGSAAREFCDKRDWSVSERDKGGTKHRSFYGGCIGLSIWPSRRCFRSAPLINSVRLRNIGTRFLKVAHNLQLRAVVARDWQNFEYSARPTDDITAASHIAVGEGDLAAGSLEIALRLDPITAPSDANEVKH